MHCRILWVEKKRVEDPSLLTGLREKGYTVEVVETGSAAIARLLDLDPDLVIVNAESMRTSGKRICQDIHKLMSNVPILLIANRDKPINGETYARAVLVPPFTIRKLLNRITPLLPMEGTNLLHVGAIRLDLEKKRVRCQGREARLTPRLASLLQLLMEHTGEVLERERLFREVWKTEYTMDTRTLDVHMSWLRQAIEEDPKKPRFIKTVRGVGYRLDV